MANSVGGVSAYTLTWKKGVPFAHSSVFRQPDRAGNSHRVGAVYSDPSTITTEHFLLDMTYEKAFLLQCQAVCGDVRTVVQASGVGPDITYPNVFVESFKVTKNNACVGPYPYGYIVILDWVVYLPEDWS